MNELTGFEKELLKKNLKLISMLRKEQKRSGSYWSWGMLAGMFVMWVIIGEITWPINL